jgi:hypothetical protein
MSRPRTQQAALQRSHCPTRAVTSTQLLLCKCVIQYCLLLCRVLLGIYLCFSTGAGTQGLTCARPVSPTLFTSVVFKVGSGAFAQGGHWRQSSYLGWDDRQVLQQLTYLLRWGCAHFLPGWPQTEILWISASQVAGITGVPYWTQPRRAFPLGLIPWKCALCVVCQYLNPF